jgi:hypothetical protein
VTDATTKPDDPKTAPKTGQHQSQQHSQKQRTQTQSRQHTSNQRQNVIPQMASIVETIFEPLPPHNVFSFRDNRRLHATSDNRNKKEEAPSRRGRLLGAAHQGERKTQRTQIIQQNAPPIR